MLPRSFSTRLAALLIAAPLFSALPAFGQISNIPSARKPVVTPKAISFGAPMEVMNSPDFATFELGLNQFVGSSAPINLTGAADSLIIDLQVPGLWKPENVNFLLKLVPAAALTKGSSLAVSVNGNLVQQYPLHRHQDPQELNIALPVKLLKSGANQLELRVTQLASAPCDEATAAQLWSQVNVAESRFTIAASRKLLIPHLSNLDDLFDRAGWSGTTQIPIFSAEKPAPERLQALGLIAQGVGQRQGNVAAAISHQPLPTAMDGLVSAMPEGSIAALVLGSFEEIAALNPDLIFPQDSGPVLAMARLPGEIARYGLFLVGASDSDLLRAATAFATQNVPWPQREWVAISRAELAPGAGLTDAGGELPLRAWGYTTKTFNHQNTDGARINLWQPAIPNPIKLQLNLSYSQGLAPDSSLAVLVDGQIAAQVALDNREGNIRERQQEVTIPAAALHPGWNSVELQPLLVAAQAAGDCPAGLPDHLSLTLHDDSSIEITDQASTDLALISGQGPLFSAHLGDDLAFHLAAADSDTLSAGLTLMAKMSQLHRSPLLNSRFGVGPVAEATRHYWVGSWDKLPEDVKPDTFTATSAAFAVPVAQSSASLDLKLTSGFDNKNVAFTTVDGDSEPTVVFAAPNARQLRDGMTSLVDRKLWQQLGGTAAYWSPNGEQVAVIGKTVAPVATAHHGTPSVSWIKVLLPLLGLAVLAVVLSKLRSRRKPQTAAGEN